MMAMMAIMMMMMMNNGLFVAAFSLTSSLKLQDAAPHERDTAVSYVEIERGQLRRGTYYMCLSL